MPGQYVGEGIQVPDGHVPEEVEGGRGGAQWAKSGGEAFLLQFSDFTKDPMHDFNRLFC